MNGLRSVGACLAVVCTVLITSHSLLAQTTVPGTNLSGLQLPNLSVPSLEVEAQPGHNHTVMVLAYSPDGSLIATAGYDQTIRIWDTHSGIVLKTLIAHKAGVTGLSFTPDGKTLVSVARVSYSTHADNRICLWDVASGELKRTFEGAVMGNANSIAISGDGKLLAGGGGSWDKKIRIWNLQSGELLTTLVGHGGSVESLAFSHDERLLASGGGGSDTDIRLWDTQTAQVKTTLTGHGAGGVISLAFSPDDRTLLTGSNDQTARLWDVASGKLLRTLAHYARGGGENVTRAVFSPDGSFVVTVGRIGRIGLLFWEASTGNKLGNVPNASYDVSFSPDGTNIAYGVGNSVHLWDVRKRQEIRVLRGSIPLSTLALSHNGSLIASGDEDGTLHLWTAHEGTLRRSWSGHKARATTLAFSADDTWLLSGGDDGAVSLWNVASGLCKWTQQAHEEGVRSVAFAGEHHVLSSGGGAAVRVTLRETGKTIPLPNGTAVSLPAEPSAGVIAVSSPQGALEPVIAVAAGNDIVLRDADDFKVLSTLRGHTGSIVGLAFSADGRQLISVGYDKTARLWDVAGGQMLRQLATLDRPFNSVAMASNDLIALGWDDLRLLKSDGKETMHSLRESVFRNPMVPMSKMFNALSFSPDGQFLYTASEDGAVRVWGVQPSGSLRPVAQMWPVASENLPPNGEPAYVTVTSEGDYVASPNTAGQLHWRLGNKSLTEADVKEWFSPTKVQEALTKN